MLSRLEKAFFKWLGVLAVVTVLLVALPTLPWPDHPTLPWLALPFEIPWSTSLPAFALWAIGRVYWPRREDEGSHDRLKPRRRALPPAPHRGEDDVVHAMVRTPRRQA